MAKGYGTRNDIATIRSENEYDCEFEFFVLSTHNWENFNLRIHCACAYYEKLVLVVVVVVVPRSEGRYLLYGVRPPYTRTQSWKALIVV